MSQLLAGTVRAYCAGMPRERSMSNDV